MKTTQRLFLPLLLLLFICAAVVIAQEEEVQTYVNTFNLFPLIIKTIMWSIMYLVIYIIALLAPLTFFRQFNGLDTEVIYWVVALWFGGLLINAAAYMLTSIHFLAALITLPLLFGWTVFISTRNFADLLLKDAIKVGIVVAILCAPWFGPTWLIKMPPKPAAESLLIRPQQPARLIAVELSRPVVS